MFKSLLRNAIATIFFVAATSSAQAVSFSEPDDPYIYIENSNSDVGSTLATATTIEGSTNESLDYIEGFLSDQTAFERYDADVYKIYITGGGDFPATVTGMTLPQEDIDIGGFPASLATRLYLFDSDGYGIYGYDSTLPANNPLTPLASGVYYLGVSHEGLSPYYNALVEDEFSESEPYYQNTPIFISLIYCLANEGVNAALPGSGTLVDFASFGSRNVSGTSLVDYRINLTRARAVPEPADGLGLLAIGILGILAKLKANKTSGQKK